jgi:hypothetical protein
MNCVGCGKPLSIHTNFDDGKKPLPDDLSLCPYCGRLYRFDDKLNLIAIPTEEERALWKDFADAMMKVTQVRGAIKTRIKLN